MTYKKRGISVWTVPPKLFFVNGRFVKLRATRGIYKNSVFTRFLMLSCEYAISRVRESNPPPRLGKPLYYRCTNPARLSDSIFLCFPPVPSAHVSLKTAADRTDKSVSIIMQITKKSNSFISPHFFRHSRRLLSPLSALSLLLIFHSASFYSRPLSFQACFRAFQFHTVCRHENTAQERAVRKPVAQTPSRKPCRGTRAL